jgi:hypothetical protein
MYRKYSAGVYFFIVVSAARLEVSTGIVDVSAGDNVEGSLVESSFGCCMLSSSLHAVMIAAVSRITNNFFI